MATHSCLCVSRYTVQTFNDDVWSRVLFNYQDRIVNFDWDAQFARATAQVAGFYMFAANLTWADPCAETQLQIKKEVGGWKHTYQGGGGSVSPQSHQWSGFVYLDVGDVITVEAMQNGSSYRSKTSADLVADGHPLGSRAQLTLQSLASH